MERRSLSLSEHRSLAWKCWISLTNQPTNQPTSRGSSSNHSAINQNTFHDLPNQESKKNDQQLLFFSHSCFFNKLISIGTLSISPQRCCENKANFKKIGQTGSRLMGQKISNLWGKPFHRNKKRIRTLVSRKQISDSFQTEKKKTHFASKSEIHLDQRR